jgi:hypothetical protein
MEARCNVVERRVVVSNESMGSLRRERDYCRQQAAVHSRAADDANRLAEQLIQQHKYCQ